MQVLKRKQLMLVKAQQKIMTVITITAPTGLLRVHQEVVPINLQELQVEAPVAAIPPVAAAVPVAVHLEVVQAAVVQATVVQATAVPVVEVNLVEAVLVAVVPVAEVNLVEAAPAAENLPVVKVQNNV